MFTYLGLFLVLISWLAGFYIVARWRDKNLPTISQHAASARSASWLFAITLIGCGLLFYLWLIKWFSPHLSLGLEFKIILSFDIVCQLITAVVPDTTGYRQLTHRTAAYTMAVLYIPLATLILGAPRLSLIARIIVSGAGTYMVGALVWVVILGRAKAQFLFFQSSYIMAFQIVILAAAYL